MASTPPPPPPPPQGIPHVPAPWSCKADVWLMTVTLKKGELPEGIYAPLEANCADFADAERAGRFEGGIGMAFVVRYRDTPVGPYDELAIVPGVFSTPPTSKVTKGASHRRITRIYVSQHATTWNGRFNWNIPKHLARFVFTTSTAEGASVSLPNPPTAHQAAPTHLAVYPPGPAGEEEGGGGGGGGAKPFFSYDLTPVRYVPSFPFSTTWLPLDATLSQPPLPRALLDPGMATPEDRTPAELLVGTEVWRTFQVVMRTKRASVVWVKAHKAQEKKEAVKWWPVDAKVWSCGVYLEDADVLVEEPREWKA